MKTQNRFLVKFTVVTAMIGFFSPSVSIKPNAQASNSYSATLSQLSVSLFNTAEARGNRSRANVRTNTRARPAPRPSTRPATRPATRPVDRNVNVNRNVNINRNVNVNNRYYGGYGHGYGYYDGRAIFAFTTGLVIGSMVAASTMPATCTTVIVNGISYRRCGSSYYQPFYQGDTLVYKVVASPY
ncbi:MAG TPA: hypothetical protein VLL31_00460 [Sulfurovum sp.]|nr:hypothetical protein [Sulfurovum sp.]